MCDKILDYFGWFQNHEDRYEEKYQENENLAIIEMLIFSEKTKWY